MTTARPEPAPRPDPGPAAGPELRLSVWPTAQRDARTQRRGRYLPESTAHPAKMLPAIAATAIRRYTEPGDLVADPMCGIGTTLVEAVHLGRDGLGIEYEEHWAGLAAANVAHARRQGAAGTAEVIRGDARLLPGLLPPGTAGRAALVVTSPPYGPSVHGQVKAEQRRGAEGGVRKYDNRYGQDPANLACQGLDDLLAGFTAILSGCAVLLRPGGLAVVTARPWRQHGELVDLPAAVIAAGARAGLVPVARCVALLAGLRGGRLIARPSFFQLDNLRRARRHGQPWHLIVHEDVLIFRNRTVSRRFGSRPPAARARGRAAGRPAGSRPGRGPGRVSTRSAQRPAGPAGRAADRREPVQRVRRPGPRRDGRDRRPAGLVRRDRPLRRRRPGAPLAGRAQPRRRHRPGLGARAARRPGQRRVAVPGHLLRRPGAGITEGTRSGLWLHIADGLRHLRPSYVYLENVAALRTRGLGKVLGDLAEIGYDTQWTCLRAADAGAPHRRDRLLILSAASQPPGPGWRLLPTPVAGAFNDGESLESWLARRERQKKLGRNGNGIGCRPRWPSG